MERKKFAKVIDHISPSEQEYVDPEKRYAHNTLYRAAIMEVIQIEGDKALVKDNTGEFWVPKQRLEIK